jgi:hypothetical protein
MQLVEIKKEELRKKKLLKENAVLQEALISCGLALVHPDLIAPPGSPQQLSHTCDTRKAARCPAPIKRDLGRQVRFEDTEVRPHVRFEDTELAFE